MKSEALEMPNMAWPTTRIAEFCQRWKITKLELFGSALREDFGPHSDIDLLATFAPDSAWTLFDHFEMEDELKEILGRDVDLIERSAVEQSRNWIRKKHILETARAMYEP